MDRQEINFLLNYLENNSRHLNSLQHEFVVSLKEHYKSTGVLTKRQIECLYAIKEYIPLLVAESAVYESEYDKYPAQYSSFDNLTTFNM
jgi:uncharacterized protein YbaR (Trm112 family)